MFLGHFGLGFADKRLEPPSERVVEWSGLAMWLLVPWGFWIARHRAIVGLR